MKDVKISVIIPVYNATKFLGECLDSVLAQTFNAYEIVCVNDGSTDDSLALLQEYQKSHSQIKIIDQKNQGVCTARNTGIANAEGKYIFLMDNDDTLIGRNCFEKVYSKAEEHQLDILCFNYSFSHAVDILKCPADVLFKGEEILCSGRVNVMPWNKLYKKELLACQACGFKDGIQGGCEDDELTLRVFMKAERVMHIKDVFYAYRTDNMDAVTSQKTSMKNVLGFKAALETLATLMQEHQDKKINTFFKRRVLFYLGELCHAALVVEEKDVALKIYQDQKEQFSFQGIDLKIIDVEEKYIENIYIKGDSKKEHRLLTLKRKLAKFYIRSIMHKC